MKTLLCSHGNRMMIHNPAKLSSSSLCTRTGLDLMQILKARKHLEKQTNLVRELNRKPE